MRKLLLMLLSISTGSNALAAPKPVDCKLDQEVEESYIIIKKHKTKDIFKYFDENCNGIIEKKENLKYMEWIAEDDEVERGVFRARRELGQSVVEPDTAKKIATVYKNGNIAMGPILRDSFSDISVFSLNKDEKTGQYYIGKKASLASGASFSWNRDFVTANTTWAAKGVAALPIIWTNENVQGTSAALAAIAIAPSFTFNRLYNTNKKFNSKDIDVETYGGSGEIKLINLPSQNVEHFLRVRGAYIGSFTGDSHGWHMITEYEPAIALGDLELRHIPTPGVEHKLPFIPVTYVLDVIARYEYLRRTSNRNTDPIFAFGPSVGRAGAVVALSVQAEQGDEAPVDPILQRVTFNTTYSWLHNLDHNINYSLFSTALGFALDSDGHFAVKASYDRGKVEETAQKIGVFKMGLAAKF
jgi:hypothetical protein